MYNFDEAINRRNTGSLKWDVPEKELPMWVADMDFQTAPEIREAMKNRMEHALYLTAGSDYGEAGRTFLRLNVACSKDILLDGLERLKKGVESFRVVKDNREK